MISIKGPIPITIHPVFFLISGLIGFLYSNTIVGTLIWMVVITFSVLVHEFGHALTANFFGQKSQINLVGFGGLTHHNGKILRPWQNFLIILNGPLAGFLLCLIAYAFTRYYSNDNLLAYGVFVAFWINLFWTILNLMPIHPLDGGKLLSIIFEKLFGHRGIKLSFFISMVVSGALSIFFFFYGMIIGGAIFALFAFENYRLWMSVQQLTKEDRDNDLQNLLTHAKRNLERGSIEESRGQLQEILSKTSKGFIYSAASEVLANIYASEGEKERALTILEPLEEMLSPSSKRLLLLLSVDLKKWGRATPLAKKLYSEIPSPEVALINALCHAHAGEFEPTLGWLKRAKADGAESIREFLQNPEFTPIRSRLEQVPSLFE